MKCVSSGRSFSLGASRWGAAVDATEGAVSTLGRGAAASLCPAPWSDSCDSGVAGACGGSFGSANALSTAFRTGGAFALPLRFSGTASGPVARVGVSCGGCGLCGSRGFMASRKAMLGSSAFISHRRGRVEVMSHHSQPVRTSRCRCLRHVETSQTGQIATRTGR